MGTTSNIGPLSQYEMDGLDPDLIGKIASINIALYKVECNNVRQGMLEARAIAQDQNSGNGELLEMLLRSNSDCKARSANAYDIIAAELSNTLTGLDVTPEQVALLRRLWEATQRQREELVAQLRAVYQTMFQKILNAIIDGLVSVTEVLCNGYQKMKQVWGLVMSTVKVMFGLVSACDLDMELGAFENQEGSALKQD